MRAKRPTRAVLIGLDGAIAARVCAYAREGKLPAIQKLIEGGVLAQNSIVPFPTITPPNWTTIATGAWPGTHGLTCFYVHTPGDPLGKIRPGYNSGDCQAEYVWEAAERAGKKSIVLNYPSTWPSRLKDGIQIGGAGVCVNEWRTDFPAPSVGPTYRCTLSDEHLFSVEFYPGSDDVEFAEAFGWDNMPQSHLPPLEATLKFVHYKSKFRVEGEVWHFLVFDEKGAGYDRVIVSLKKDANAAFANLGVGEWTKTVTRGFETERGPKRAAFRCKLLELSSDAEKFRLYVTPISALDGWSHPEDIAQELSCENGIPIVNGGFLASTLEWVDPQTFLEILDLEHNWLADAAVHLLREKEWDLFLMHVHGPDWLYHCFSNKMDPATAGNVREPQQYQDYELSMYQGLDRMIQRIQSAIPDDSLVIVVSDHGCKAEGRHFAASRVLLNKSGQLL